VPGRGAGPGSPPELDSAGGVPAGCSEHPSGNPPNFRRRAARPVPAPGPVRGAGSLGCGGCVGLGVRGRGSGLGCRCLVVAAVRLLVGLAGVSVRVCRLSASGLAWLSGRSRRPARGRFPARSLGSAVVVAVPGGVCVAPCLFREGSAGALRPPRTPRRKGSPAGTKRGSAQFFKPDSISSSRPEFHRGKTRALLTPRSGSLTRPGAHASAHD
jgi:hypothetical protein